MKKNMGNADRIIRVLAAVVIGVLLLNGSIAGTGGIVLGILAIVFLATGALRTCPLYIPLGISTKKSA